MKIKTSIILGSIVIFSVGILLGRLTMGSGSSAHDSHNVERQDNEIWTCSMDPQVKLPDPGDCPICGMDLIPLVVDGAFDEAYNPNALRMSERSLKLAEVMTTVIGAKSSGTTLTLNGKVQEDKSRIFTQAAHFPGRIESLYINTTGEYVRRGQRIAAVYSPELITAQEELFTAKQFGQEDLVQSVRQKLKLWKLSDQEIAAIENDNVVRSEIDLLADASGYVSAMQVQNGDHVKEGSKLFDVSDLSRVWVDFEGYERDLAQVAIGDQIVFTVASLPSEQFESRVTFIDPYVDPSSRTAVIRTEVSNVEGRLKPEMLTRGKLNTRQPTNQAELLVPATAVLWTGERSIVYVQVPDSTLTAFEMREVQLGDRTGDAYVVAGGLQMGDKVVTNGTFSIDAAAQLQGKRSMMNQTPTGKMSGHSH